MSALNIVKPKTAIEKRTRTTVDTIMVCPDRLHKWKLPSGQRPLKENSKVVALSKQIKSDGGVIPGMLTIGVLDTEYWIIDGQHRLHAFSMTGLKEGFADVRWFHAQSMSDINREFVDLNSKLVTMRPDDFLRGLEGSLESLTMIRRVCPFIGYDKITRGKSASILSMAVCLRCWAGSAQVTPTNNAGMGTLDLAENMTQQSAKDLTDFLTIAHAAFGREPEYGRLWNALNLIMCMWLYRNLVMQRYSPATPQITKDAFRKCLMSVSADSVYQDWLLGRNVGDRDRSPCYHRLKGIFAKRLEVEIGKVRLPSPDWDKRGS